MSSTLSARVLLLLTFSLVPSHVWATCYWQDSALAPDSPDSIAPDDTACFPDQDNSPCCGTGWSCLSDGVCMISQAGNDFYYRGTCTDRTWNSQQCPGWCFAQNSNTSIPLAKCDSAQDWYCCPGDADCSCETGKNAVKLGAEQPTTVTVIGSTTWPGYTPTTAAFTAQPLNTEGTSTTDDTSATGGSVSGSDSSPTASSFRGSDSPTAAAASETSTGTATAEQQNNNNNGGGGGTDTALAAGLGAGLGVAAVVAVGGLACFFMRRRRRRQAGAAAATADAGAKDGPSASSSFLSKSAHAGGAPPAQNGYGGSGVHEFYGAGSEQKREGLDHDGERAVFEAPGAEVQRKVEMDGGVAGAEMDGAGAPAGAAGAGAGARGRRRPPVEMEA